MKNIIKSSLKAGILSVMITGSAIADDSLAPIGTLQVGTDSNTRIQNELGSFAVSGNYTVITGDQIRIGDSEYVSTLALEGGKLYVSPNSLTTLSKSNGVYTLELTSGSIGYELRTEGTLRILSGEQEITPVASNGDLSGAVALGPNGKLAVSPVQGTAIVTSSDGVVTTVTQGQTWADADQVAEMVLTQDLNAQGGLSGLLVMAGMVAGGLWLMDDDGNPVPPSDSPPSSPPVDTPPPPPANTPPSPPSSSPPSKSKSS